MQTTDLSVVLPTFAAPGSSVPPGTPLNKAEGIGMVAGPSEFFMRRVVKSLIRGSCSRNYNQQLESVCDPAGAYFRYKKAYAGIAYEVFSGPMYDYTTDFTSGNAVAGFPRIRLGPTGDFLNSPSCKELLGLRVLGLAGLNPDDETAIVNGLYYVPGGTATNTVLANGLPLSPFLNKLLPGDQITHINGLSVGDLAKQIAPSLVTWRLCAGDHLEVTYRRGGNAPNAGDNGATENYDNLYIHNACLAEFPALLDYPWYAVNKFPLLSERGFTFPADGATQSVNPQVPALNATTVGAVFRPAI